MKKLSGFSLMEMMVVLLIVSIIAAATAPMINRKLMNDAIDTSPWIWTRGRNAGFNILGQNSVATIGREAAPNAAQNARLYIDTRSRNIPQLALGFDGGGVLKLKSYSETISLSTTDDYNFPGNAVIVGAQAHTTNAGNNTVAIGCGAFAKRPNDIAIGTWSETSTSEYGTTVVGSSARGFGNRSTVIGTEATATENGVLSSLLGFRATSDGFGGVAIGYNSFASGQGAIAIGPQLESENANTRTSANGRGNLSIGYGTDTTGERNIAIGQSAIAGSNVADQDADDCIAIGHGANARSNNSIAIGNSARTRGEGAIVIGRSAEASNNTITIGNNIESLAGSVAIGGSAEEASVTLGIGAVSDQNAVAIGHAADADGPDSIAIGFEASAEGNNSIAIGSGAVATESNQIVLGTPGDTVYIPGNLVVGGKTVLINRVAFTLADEVSNYITPASVNSSGGLKYMPAVPGEGIFGSAYGFDNLFEMHTFSDRRLKNVGKVFSAGLEEIKKLEVFNYTFKKDPDKTPRVGVMAQDLQKIFPDAVIKGEDGFLRIRMEDMFYALVNAVKDLDAKIEKILAQEILELKNKVTILEKENIELKKQNKEIMKRLEDLEKKLK